MANKKITSEVVQSELKTIVNVKRGKVIPNPLEEAYSLGLTDVKGAFDNKGIEIQGKDEAGNIRYCAKKFFRKGEIGECSKFSEQRTQEELKEDCNSLKNAGYTQVQIAKRLGISQSWVSQILNKQ